MYFDIHGAIGQRAAMLIGWVGLMHQSFMMTFVVTPGLELLFGIAFVMWIGATACLVSFLACIWFCFLDRRAQVTATTAATTSNTATDSEVVVPTELQRVLKCAVVTSFNNTTLLPIRTWPLIFINATFSSAVFGFVTLSGYIWQRERESVCMCMCIYVCMLQLT
jgi:hypothetical protein